MAGLENHFFSAAVAGVFLSLITVHAFAAGTPTLPKTTLCHNIGSPRDLGANCEATGRCTFILPGGVEMVFTGSQFLGTVVKATGANAIAAHIAHGDGWIIGPVYKPPLHMASVVGPHRVSNVECIGERLIPQPGERGN